MPKPTLIVVDANVWLDAFIPARRRSESARSFLVKARSLGCELAFPSHILVTVFFEVAREAKRWFRESYGSLSEEQAAAAQSQAWSCVKDMTNLATPLGSGLPETWLAEKYRSFNGDLEDNLVMAACELAGADFLATSDQQLQRKATVAALGPEDLSVLLEARK